LIKRGLCRLRQVQLAFLTSSATMAEENEFDTLLDALKGETILVQPRVSRETMIYVMKEHTDMLREMRNDVNEMKKVSAELKSQAAENQRMMVELNYSVKDNRKDITELFSNVGALRTELDGVQTKLLEINELRGLIKEQRTNFEDLSNNYQQFKVKTNQNHVQVVDDVKCIEKQSNDTAFETKELRHIVDHFGDNLILSSNQITVESTVGFSKRPMSLYDVMKYCQRDLEDLNTAKKNHEARIVENTEAITTKADATVAFAVQTLDKDVLAIKNHLKQEEDQGISAIRRQCDMLTNAVESLQSGISDKIDRGVAELIVQKKYEDIVQYLQDALTATGEDEDNFKNMALELDEKMKKLASSKSDRLEIQPIQDSLVKVEAAIAKLSGDKKDTRRENDFYSKQQVEDMLYEKVDKESLEEFVNTVIKNRRGKATRMASNGNIGPNSSQMISDTGSTGGGGRDPGSRNPIANNGQIKMSQSTSSLRGNKGPQQSVNTTDINSSADLQTPQHGESITSKHRPPKGGFPTTQPGKFRQGSEKGIPGGSKEIMHQQEMERTGEYDDSSAFTQHDLQQQMIDSGYGGPPKGPPKHTLPQGTSNGGVIPGRNLQPDGVPQGVFPPINVPARGGAGQRGGNRGGGGGGGGGGVYEHYTDEDAGDSYDYMGAATQGGGFNCRSPTKVISNPTALSSGLSDINARQVESFGKVPIVGQDGKFYQSDQEVQELDVQQHSSIINPVLDNIEVAPLQPTPTPSVDPSVEE